MPEPTPFYPRTSQYCKSMQWRYWGDYFVPRSYEVHHDVEYYAIRNSAGLIDITPLYKYDITGPGRNASRGPRYDQGRQQKCKVGQVMYSAWCDEEGKTHAGRHRLPHRRRLLPDHPADPIYRWLKLNSIGMNVEIRDVSTEIASLALQGPLSREILKQLVHIDDLKFFRLTSEIIEGIPVVISRTGYTGDLGYEIFVPFEMALPLYDLLIEAGKPLRNHPRRQSSRWI